MYTALWNDRARCARSVFHFVRKCICFAVQICAMLQRGEQLFEFARGCEIGSCKPPTASTGLSCIPSLTTIEPFNGPDAGELADRWRQAGALWDARQQYIMKMQAALPARSLARLPFFSESASILPPASTVPALPRAAVTPERLRLIQPDDEHARIHGPSQSPAGLFTLRVRVFKSMLLSYKLLIGLCSSISLERFLEFWCAACRQIVCKACKSQCRATVGLESLDRRLGSRLRGHRSCDIIIPGKAPRAYLRRVHAPSGLSSLTTNLRARALHALIAQLQVIERAYTSLRHLSPAGCSVRACSISLPCRSWLNGTKAP